MASIEPTSVIGYRSGRLMRKMRGKDVLMIKIAGGGSSLVPNGAGLDPSQANESK
jgi:hypothetical protein